MKPNLSQITPKKITTNILTLVVVASWSLAFFVATDVRLDFSKEPSVTQVSSGDLDQSIGWQKRETNNQDNNRRTSFLPQSSSGQVLGTQTENSQVDLKLTLEEIVNLNKPGVVNIINSLSGNFTIADFDVDIMTFSLSPRWDLEKHVTPVDSGALGSGFFVTPNGHIITNAHVLDKKLAQQQLKEEVENHYADLFRRAQDQLSDEDYRQYQNYLDSVYGVQSVESDAKIAAALELAINNYIEANLEDEVKQNIVVVDKALAKNKLPENSELAQIFQTGLPATVLGFDEDFEDNAKDVALLKISEKNLPALSLGSSENLSIGGKAISLGYPSNAKITEGDLFEPTFTEGVIGAVKTYKEQKVIQLDNKISPGSSGGPLIDANGKVIGIVTFETGSRQSGDNFGFALPVELAKELMEELEVKNETGAYQSNFLLGLGSKNNLTCKQALTQFNQAGANANIHFPVKNELAKSISDCENLISNGQSKDSAWDVFRIFFRQHTPNAIIFSVLALAIIIFGIFMIVRFFRHLREHKIVPHFPAPPRPAV